MLCLRCESATQSKRHGQVSSMYCKTDVKDEMDACLTKCGWARASAAGATTRALRYSVRIQD